MNRKSIATLVAAPLVLVSTAGCSEPTDQRPETETSPTAPTVSQADIATRADFEIRELDWPLTVDEARLGCTKTSRWAEVNGVRYALNGQAKGQGYEPIEAIWLEDEAMNQLIREELESRGASAANEPPVRINIGDMITEAGKLCVD